jgi:hypothetical protein
MLDENLAETGPLLYFYDELSLSLDGTVLESAEMDVQSHNSRQVPLYGSLRLRRRMLETAGVADRELDSCLIRSPLFSPVFELLNIPSDVRLNSVVK